MTPLKCKVQHWVNVRMPEPCGSLVPWCQKGHGWDDGVTHGNTVTKRHPRLFEMICLFEVKKCTRTNISRDDYSYHVVAKQVFVVNIFCRQVFDHVNPQSLPLKFPRSLQTL